MSLTVQFYTMLSMIAMGSFFGAALDTYSRFLKRNKRKKWIIFINDILFWLFQGLVIFYVLYTVNKGEVRFYIFLALLCGYAAYQSLLKRIYLNLLEKIIRISISFYKMMVHAVQLFIVKPIRSLISLLIAIGTSILLMLKSLLLFIWKIMKWLFFIFKYPIQLILNVFWKIVPKNVKNFFISMYNKMKGFFSRIKNRFNKDKN